MEIQARQIHHEAHAVHHGHDLSKKVYLVLIQVRVQCVQHRRERIRVCRHIDYDPVQLKVIHQMTRKHAKG